MVSLVGRDPHLLLRQLAPGTASWCCPPTRRTPAIVAGLLTSYGYGATRDRRARRPRVGRGVAHRGDRRDLVGRVAAPQRDRARARRPVVGSWAAGLPDDAFEHDGQLTKRDLRAGALARLAPQPGQLLWDVGAGAGSVGIEWMRAHPRCRAIAVEADADRADADRAQRAPPRRPAPARSCTAAHPTRSPTCPTRTRSSSAAARPSPGCSTTCLARLRPGGRLVVHGVTLETEALLAAAVRRARRRADPALRRARRADRLVHRLDPGPRRHDVGAGQGAR